MKAPRPVLVRLARLRARLRASELGLVLLAIVVGVLAGLAVSAMTAGRQFRACRDLRHPVRHAPQRRPSASLRSQPSPRRCSPASRSAPSTSGGRRGSCPPLWTRSRPTPCAAGACRCPRACSSPPRRCCRTAAALRSAWRRATRRSAAASPRGSESTAGCADTTCACWWAAGRAGRSRRRSARR